MAAFLVGQFVFVMHDFPCRDPSIGTRDDSGMTQIQVASCEGFRVGMGPFALLASCNLLLHTAVTVPAYRQLLPIPPPPI